MKLIKANLDEKMLEKLEFVRTSMFSIVDVNGERKITSEGTNANLIRVLINREYKRYKIKELKNNDESK